MIEIHEIYFLKTENNSPYTFNVESVFERLEPSVTDNLVIDSLKLNDSEVLHLDCPLKGYLDFDIDTDYEESLPQVSAMAGTNYVGTPIFDYRFALTLGNEDVEFSKDFRNLLHYLVSNTWQIVYRSNNSWFICYAEFQAVNTKITNDAIQSILFESRETKENIFSIGEFGVEPAPTVWTQVADTVSSYQQIISIVKFNGKIYGVGYKNIGGIRTAGVLFEWNGTDAWVEVAPYWYSNTFPNVVNKLLVYNGELYGGGNVSNDGYLKKWDGVNAWINCILEGTGQDLPNNGIRSMVEYNSKIYLGTYHHSSLNGGQLWEWGSPGPAVQKAPQLGSERYIYFLLEYGGSIYGGTGIYKGCLYKFTTGDTAWTQVAPQFGTETRVLNGVEFNGKIYASSYPSGLLLEHTPGVSGWVQKAPQTDSDTILALTVRDGSLYGAGNVSGKLKVWNNVDAWVDVVPQLGTESYIRSILTDGTNIYAGTGNNAKLYKW